MEQFTNALRKDELLNSIVGNPTTCSVGITNATKANDAVVAISIADKLMYQAKQSKAKQSKVAEIQSLVISPIEYRKFMTAQTRAAVQ